MDVEGVVVLDERAHPHSQVVDLRAAPLGVDGPVNAARDT